MKRAPEARRSKPRQRPPRRAGYGSKWDRVSKLHRRKEPTCRECRRMGIVSPWGATDHIIPVDGPNDPLFYEPTNHQSLCMVCHGLKSNREGRGMVITWEPTDRIQVVTGETIQHYLDHWQPKVIAEGETLTIRKLQGQRPLQLSSALATGPVAITTPRVDLAFDTAEKCRARLVHTHAAA